MSSLPTTGSPTDQTAMPSAFPAPGSFGVTQRITLLCVTPGATIHYTLDGSTPDRASLIDDLREGAVFDPGDRTLRMYEVPGHSPGHSVLFDEANGILLASDAVGSNRPTITDSLWMQFPGMAPIDDFLSSLQVFRSKVAGKIVEIHGGHNDVPFSGETYLDNLQRAAQLLVDPRRTPNRAFRGSSCSFVDQPEYICAG
jgi:glyoxylase-like metal-dependent hydrolase (beta-lactamase superfamily II)